MQTMSIEIVGRMLDARAIKPDADFTAVAGADYGYVAAWQMPDGQWLIRYGDSRCTGYALSESGDELWSWLLTDDLSGAERILHIANVLGIDYIELAGDDDDGPFAVIVTRWLNGTQRSHFAQERGKPMQFTTFAQAQAWIDEAAAKVHYEIGEPEYIIVQIEEERHP